MTRRLHPQPRPPAGRTSTTSAPSLAHPGERNVRPRRRAATRSSAATLLVLALLLLAREGAAQPADSVPAGPAATAATGTASAQSAAADRPVSIGLFGYVGTFSAAAAESFRAVLDKTSGFVFGGGGQVVVERGPLRGLFVEVDVSRFEETGERAFVHDGQVFRLGIPLTVTMTPIEFTGGYRFTPRSRGTRAPFAVFGGCGIGSLQYREVSDFAEAGEDVDDRFTSYHVMGGLEFAIGGPVRIGAEGRYRWVPDGLGAGGVSEAFNETDLGGAMFRVRFGVAF